MKNLIPALVPIFAQARGSRTVATGELLPPEVSTVDAGGEKLDSAKVWAPVLAAMLLDVADLLSLGPQGLFVGLVIGSTLGWRIAAMSGFSAKGRMICAGLAALYCMFPFTELLPLATMLTTASRILTVARLFRRA